MRWLLLAAACVAVGWNKEGLVYGSEQLPTPVVVVEPGVLVQAPGVTVQVGQGVSVQAPGVSVRVGDCGGSGCQAPVFVPRRVLVPQRVLVPRTVLVPGIVLQPAQPVIVRRPYWTPVRDILFGRFRVRYLPVQ